MKKHFKQFIDALREFTDGLSQVEALEKAALTQLEQSIERLKIENPAVHIIYTTGSFSGDIIRYDKKRRQLVIRDFDKSTTKLIDLKDIKKISQVPESVRKSQQLDET